MNQYVITQSSKLNALVNSPNTRNLIARRNLNGGKLPHKVAILYTYAKREYYYSDEAFLTNQGSDEEAFAFSPYLKALGVEVCYIRGDADMAKICSVRSPTWLLI